LKINKKKNLKKKVKISLITGKKIKKIKEKYSPKILKSYGKCILNKKKIKISKIMMKHYTDLMDKD